MPCISCRSCSASRLRPSQRCSASDWEQDGSLWSSLRALRVLRGARQTLPYGSRAHTPYQRISAPRPETVIPRANHETHEIHERVPRAVPLPTWRIPHTMRPGCGPHGVPKWDARFFFRVFRVFRGCPLPCRETQPTPPAPARTCPRTPPRSPRSRRLSCRTGRGRPKRTAGLRAPTSSRHTIGIRP